MQPSKSCCKTPALEATSVNNPAVSVLITLYNREKYVAAAIESVLAQTFQDFELIIVDDFSQDRSLEIARQHATSPRVQVHVNKANLGDYANRNRAAALARGRFLKFLDADDIMYPHCLEIMTQQMERFPEAALGLQSEVVYKWPQPLPLLLSPAEAYREHFFRQGILDQGPTGAMLRADVFHKFGGFVPERYTGDTELFLLLARQAPVVVCGKGLTWWRRHPGQESMLELSDGPVLAKRYWIILKALAAKDCPLEPRERRQAVRRVRKKILESAAVIARHGKLRLAWLLCGTVLMTKCRIPTR